MRVRAATGAHCTSKDHHPDRSPPIELASQRRAVDADVYSERRVPGRPGLDLSHRPLVGRAIVDRCGLSALRHLLQLGGVPGRLLLLRQLPLALLFAVAVRRPGTRGLRTDRACLARGLAGVVARHLAAVLSQLAGLADPGWPAVLSPHLLLLPQVLLPGVFLHAAGVCGGRSAAPQLPR